MPYILAFDTETTGLPQKNAPLEAQPHIIQLAFSLYTLEQRPVFEVSTLVALPEGVNPSPQAEAVHGISGTLSREVGVTSLQALSLLRAAANRATVVVAHNAQFDLKLLDFEAKRHNVDHPLAGIKTLCTCDAATPIVNLPPTPAMLRAGFTSPKRAKLSECWTHFFSEDLLDAHDALVDTRGCARVYFHLEQMGAFS